MTEFYLFIPRRNQKELRRIRSKSNPRYTILNNQKINNLKINLKFERYCTHRILSQTIRKLTYQSIKIIQMNQRQRQRQNQNQNQNQSHPIQLDRYFSQKRLKRNDKKLYKEPRKTFYLIITNLWRTFKFILCFRIRHFHFF